MGLLNLGKSFNQDLILDLPNDQGVTERELHYLVKAVIKLKPKTILEIGTKFGRTTINLAKFSPLNSKIFTLDIHPHLEFITKQPTNLLSKIVFIQANSLFFDFSTLGISKFDFIFIDANHTFPYVIADTRIALSLISHKSYIFWHDYGTKNEKIQVKAALNSLGFNPFVFPKTRLAYLSYEDIMGR